MDPIDEALLEAWSRVAPVVRRDRLEALRRSFRRTRPLLARPIRPWCLCLRASDTRLNVHAWVPKYLPQQHEPHEITIFSDTIRELCKPVTIPWPGWDWERAAYALGRHPASLRSWIKRGVFRVNYIHAQTMGKRGKPVPEIWSPSPLDPNADLGRAPDPVWGTLWQYLWQRVPDDLEFTLTRVPIARPHPGDHPSRTCHRGWQFICPGLPAALTPPVARCQSPVASSCGRATGRLFIPLRPWTVLDALGVEDPLEVTLPLPSQRGSSTAAKSGAPAAWSSSAARDSRRSGAKRPSAAACSTCWPAGSPAAGSPRASGSVTSSSPTTSSASTASTMSTRVLSSSPLSRSATSGPCPRAAPRSSPPCAKVSPTPRSPAAWAPAATQP